MKKVLAMLLLAVFLVGGTVQVVHAQGSFLIGALFGAVLFGGDGDGKAMATGSGATVLYTLQRASERVASPLDVRLSAVNYNGKREELVVVGKSKIVHDDVKEWQKRKGQTFQEIFAAEIPASTKYEILQVVRVARADSTWAVIWFAYIEKEKVIPLGKIPAQE